MNAAGSKYGPWISEVPQPNLGSDIKLRLFCVPPVGMGGASFHPWATWTYGQKKNPMRLERKSWNLLMLGFVDIMAIYWQTMANQQCCRIGTPLKVNTLWLMSLGLKVRWRYAHPRKLHRWCLSHHSWGVLVLLAIYKGVPILFLNLWT